MKVNGFCVLCKIRTRKIVVTLGIWWKIFWKIFARWIEMKTYINIAWCNNLDIHGNIKRKKDIKVFILGLLSQGSVWTAFPLFSTLVFFTFFVALWVNLAWNYIWHLLASYTSERNVLNYAAAQVAWTICVLYIFFSHCRWLLK